jgi:large subunit ribosomal protein L10Ae
MTTKITTQNVVDAIKEMREGKKKDRKFVETVELQVSLKDYDPNKDKRFAGSVRLPNVPRPNLKICIIADAKHAQEVQAKNINIAVSDMDSLKKFNKDKKLIKTWAKKYTLLLASDSLIKQVPAVLGPILQRINRFPQVVSHNTPLLNQVEDVRASVKFQLKKVTCFGCAVGRVDMTDEELRENIMMALNFLASLLKKGWHNLKTVFIKTTMGKPISLL